MTNWKDILTLIVALRTAGKSEMEPTEKESPSVSAVIMMDTAVSPAWPSFAQAGLQGG